MKKHNLEGIITHSEVLNVLNSMKNDKSPDSDRFTVEFVLVLVLYLTELT